MTTLIIGAGPIGTTLAQQYVAASREVRILTRSGTGLDHPLAERVAADASDLQQLRRAASGATVIHHCAHASAYTVAAWSRELPAMESAVLQVAGELGATVVFPESLYAFDLAGVVTEATPIVATTGKPGVRARLLAARAAAAAPTVSVVASDYFGPGAGANAHAGDRMVQPVVSGGTVRPLGSLDQPHSWTYPPDLAAAMGAAADLAPEPDRLLFAPTGPARTQREVITAYAAAAGRAVPRIAPLPTWLLRTLGPVNPGISGLVEMIGLLTQPLVMDSRQSEAVLDLAPTPWEDAVRETVAAARRPVGAATRRPVAR